MGYSNRSTCRNLLLEQRNNTSVRTKHISEANSNKFRLRTCVIRLHNHFAHSLGCAHNISRINGLIRRDKHHSLNTISVAHLRQLQCAIDVVLNSLTRAVLHKRHMLMGRRMEHNLRLVCTKYIVHSVGIANRGNKRHQVKLRVCHLKFLLNIIGVVLIYLHNHQLRWLEVRNLSAQLGTNTTTATSNHNNLVSHVLSDSVIFHLNLVTTKKVLNRDITKLTNRDLIINNLIHSRQGLNATGCIRAQINNCLKLFTWKGWDGNENVCYSVFLNCP